MGSDTCIGKLCVRVTNQIPDIQITIGVLLDETIDFVCICMMCGLNL